MAKAKSVSIEDPDFGNDVVVKKDPENYMLCIITDAEGNQVRIGDNALDDLADVLKNFHKVLPGGDD